MNWSPKTKELFLHVAPPPHLTSGHSSIKTSWWQFAALIPLASINAIYFGWKAIFIVVLACVSTAFFEIVFQFPRTKKLFLKDASSLIYAVFFALILPVNIPIYLIVLGSFTATILAKELFGGTGENLFHPSVTAFAVLNLLNPELFTTEMFIASKSMVWIALTGILFLIKKWIRWESVLFYSLTFLACAYFSEMGIISGNLWVVLLCAFFFVTDSSSTPIAQKGRVIYASLCGLFSLVFTQTMFQVEAISASVLILNAASPLIDRFFKAD